MKRQYLFTIRAKHVGRGGLFDNLDRTGTEASIAREAIGTILRADIDKQVFRVDGVVQVENNAQRNARLANRAKGTLKLWPGEKANG